MHAIKVYGRSVKFPAHTFLTDFEIEAESEIKAGKIARKRFADIHKASATIEKVELAGTGFRRTPGFGKAV